MSIQLSEIGPQWTMSELSSKFRSDEPCILTYGIPELGWRGVIACAPLNTAFGAVDSLARLIAPDVIEWGRGLIDDPTVYRAFDSVLRRNRLRKEDAPATLLWPFAGFGAYLDGRKRAFGTKAPYIDYLRIQGWLLPNDAANTLESILEQIVQESSEWAFCHVDEGMTKRLHSRWPQSDVPSLFGAPFVISGEESALCTTRLTHVFTDLVNTCLRLSNHPQTSFEAHYHEICRPRLDLFANGSGFASARRFDELASSIVEKRIELVRLLGWPTFTVSVFDALTSYASNGFAEAKYDWIRAALRKVIADLRMRYRWLDATNEMKSILKTACPGPA